MNILGIDHVQLAMPVGGEALARAFYAEALGIREVPKPEALAARGGCWFGANGVKIHLGVEADFRAAKKAHPALLVRNLAELSARLGGLGYHVRPDESLPGVARAFVDDPFGNRIELIQA